MSKQLVMGLDVGTNSLGWALVRFDEGEETSKQIVAAGVRIFPRGVEDKTPTPKNQKRRERRLARRVIQRRARRKQRMVRLLVEHNLLPLEILTGQNVEGTLNNLGDPYLLRAKALDHPLNSHELGRVLLHLVQRRGFLSNKKTLLGRDMLDDPDVLAELAETEESEAGTSNSEETAFKAEINSLRNSISEEGYRSLGEFLASKGPHECKRNRDGQFIRTDRKMYHDEFTLIVEAQRSHHTALTDKFIETLEQTIFHQRPIKLKEGRVGKCTLEPNSQRIAIARLEYQRFRYLCDINNLRYFEAQKDTEVGLSSDQRELLVELFEAKSDVTFPAIRKALGLDKTADFNLDSGVKKLKGNRTSVVIRSCFPKWDNLSEEEKHNLVDDLLSFQKKSALKRRLISFWKCSPQEAVKLCMVELESGRGSLSRKAIVKLLPYLREGHELSQARKSAGYSYEMQKGERSILATPPDIPNPIVSRSLNEVRRLVNAVVKEHGKPTVIRVEMARDLEMNTKRYKAFVAQQSANTKENEKATEEFKKTTGQAFAKKNDKLKYRLWKDQRFVSAYSNRQISLAQLFSAEVEIDHVIPYSVSLDDSYQNKVVCFAGENREKGQRTPIDAFLPDASRWEQITQLISKWGKHLSSKRSRFFQTADSLSDRDFIASQLNDTRYIAKETGQYLKTLGVGVTFTKGVMTSILRRSWDLNTLISESDFKNRRDHRHHAIDAIVTACIDQNLYRSIVFQAKNIENSPHALKLEDLHFDPPMSDIREQTESLLNEMIVSHASSRKLSGALHEETAVGYVSGVGTVYRKRLSPTFKVGDAAKIYDRTVREIVEDHLRKFGGDPKIAFSPDNPVYHRDGKTLIKRVRVQQAKIGFDTLNETKFAVSNSLGIPFKWFAYGNIHSLNVFRNEDGKLRCEVVQMAEAARLKRNKLEASERPHIQIHKNDSVLLTVDGMDCVYRVQKIESPNKLTLKPHNVSGAEKDQTQIRKSVPTLLRDYHLRKVRVNILGDVRDD